MLEYKDFEYYLHQAVKYRDLVNKLPSFINYDDPIFDFGNMMFNAWIDSYFTEDGYDWISWWLYEKHSLISDKVYEAHDKDGNIIPTDTIEDLWNLVKEYRK